MLALFNGFFDLVLMRLPPQAFPASRFLFGVTLCAFLPMAFASNYALSADAGYSLARTALSVLNLCLGTALILLITRRPERWQQTVTALFGGETVIGLVLLPVLVARAMGIENVFMLLSMLLFMGWELAFLAHVYRNALETSMGAALLVAVVYVVLSSLLKQLLIPVPAVQ